MKEVRCAGFYGDDRRLTEPSCGWEGARADLIDGKTCPVCSAGHIVTLTVTNQSRVAAWMDETFSQKEIDDAPERTLRHVEEALELAQACDVDAATLHRLVDYVFSRPVGNPKQEIAGSLVTLYAAASALDVDVQVAFEDELERIQRPEVIERCRRRQHEKREALADHHAEVLAAAGPDPTVWCTCGADSNEHPTVRDPRLAWRHSSHCAHSRKDPEPTWLGPERYSQATKDAHGALIEAGWSCLTDDDLDNFDRPKKLDRALRHLAMMVHCDRTGELRAPHSTFAPNDEKEFCTCGIYPGESATVPDPRLAWRHSRRCAHYRRSEG